MANKRKGQSGAVRLVPAIKAIVLCGLIGGSTVGYVLQKNQIYALGQQIKDREVRLKNLRTQNKIHAGQLANLQLPQNLAKRAQDLNLGLVPPQPGQMVWLPDPATVGTTAPTNSATPRTPLLVIQQPGNGRLNQTPR
jgi:hypothetical protein